MITATRRLIYFIPFFKVVGRKRALAILLATWTAFAAISGAVLKGVLDSTVRGWQTRDEKALKLQEDRLSQFWWPIYFRMEVDTKMWPSLHGPMQDPKLAPIKAELAAALLENHDQMEKILASNFHLAATSMSPELRTLFVDYFEHITFLRAIRKASLKDISLLGELPVTFGRPWPGQPNSAHPCPKEDPNDCFVNEIRRATAEAQKQYDEQIATLFPRLGRR